TSIPPWNVAEVLSTSLVAVGRMMLPIGGGTQRRCARCARAAHGASSHRCKGEALTSILIGRTKNGASYDGFWFTRCRSCRKRDGSRTREKSADFVRRTFSCVYP